MEKLQNTGTPKQNEMMTDCIRHKNSLFDVLLVLDVDDIDHMDIHQDKSPSVEIRIAVEETEDDFYSTVFVFPGDMERQKFVSSIMDLKKNTTELDKKGNDPEDEDEEEQLEEVGEDEEEKETKE